MSRRLKVLISAYACEPNKGSEPEVGWQWSLQMARFHDVTVITRTNNRARIQRALESLGGEQPVPKFIYHDRNSFLLKMKQRSRTIKLYYLLWQRSAREVIGRLNEVHQFDLMHHVTFAGFRYPTAIWGHGVASIWGPIGGIESVPFRLLPWRHSGSLAHEGLRNISNALQAAPNNVLPKRARATTLILASTPEMQRAFGAFGFSAELMPTIGLKTQQLPYRPQTRAAGALKLLFAGNIITLKGIDLAIDALKASGTDATLTLVGAGNYASTAKKRAEKLGLSYRVIFLGRLPREQLLKMYPDYDVFIFPSLHDTGGYAVIEAMFNQLPVICLDCGGPAVAVRPGCGVKVPLGPRSKIVAELAAAIRRFDRDRPMMLTEGKAAHEVVINFYDWDKKGEQMHERYLAAIAKHKEAQNQVSDTPRYSGMGRVSDFLHRMFSLQGLVISALGLLLIGTVFFVSVGNLKQQARWIVEDTLPGLSYAGGANASLAQAFNRTLMLLMTDSTERRRELKDEIERLSRTTTSYLNAYKGQIYGKTDLAYFHELLKHRADYLRVREQTIRLHERRQKQEALALYQGRLLPSYYRYKEAGDKLFEYNVAQARSRGRNIMAICTLTQFAVAGVGVIIFILGFLIGTSR